MSPKGQVFAALSVLVPVALSGLALVALAPGLWWLFTTYFWVSFPALGLLRRGLAGLFGGAAASTMSQGKEREILEALRDHGDLTPARAALQTSLTVAEAGGMLERLATDGHLGGQGAGRRPLLRPLGVAREGWNAGSSSKACTGSRGRSCRDPAGKRRGKTWRESRGEQRA